MESLINSFTPLRELVCFKYFTLVESCKYNSFTHKFLHRGPKQGVWCPCKDFSINNSLELWVLDLDFETWVNVLGFLFWFKNLKENFRDQNRVWFMTPNYPRSWFGMQVLIWLVRIQVLSYRKHTLLARYWNLDKNLNYFIHKPLNSKN